MQCIGQLAALAAYHVLEMKLVFYILKSESPIFQGASECDLELIAVNRLLDEVIGTVS